jgi:hypothetical protein
MWRTSLCAGLITVGCASVSADAQELELFLSIQGAIEAYPIENRTSAGYLTYSAGYGEQPVILQITLVNESANSARVERDGGWIGSVSISFQTLDGRTLAAAVPFDVIRQEETSARHHRALLQLKTHPRAPGIYRVRATLDRTAVTGISPNTDVRLSPTETLEIRDIESTNDTLNFLYTSYSQLRAANRLQDARHQLIQLLAKRPTSVIAWSELGYTWAAEGNCDAAADAFKRADDLIRTNADPEERTARIGARPDMQRQMQRRLRACP